MKLANLPEPNALMDSRHQPEPMTDSERRILALELDCIFYLSGIEALSALSRETKGGTS